MSFNIHKHRVEMLPGFTARVSYAPDAGVKDPWIDFQFGIPCLSFNPTITPETANAYRTLADHIDEVFAAKAMVEGLNEVLNPAEDAAMDRLSPESCFAPHINLEG